MTGAAQIPLERIAPNPANIREQLRGLEELAASMRAVGVLQPLLVTPDPRGGRLQIIDGHRRYAAAQMAGLPTAPCLASKTRPGADHVVLMLAAALQQQLTPIEEARAFESLRHRGLTVSAIARTTGRSARLVSERLLLATLPREAQDLVEADELGVTDATALARDLRDQGAGVAPIRTRKPRGSPRSTPWQARSEPDAPTPRPARWSGEWAAGSAGRTSSARRSLTLRWPQDERRDPHPTSGPPRCIRALRPRTCNSARRTPTPPSKDPRHDDHPPRRRAA